MCGSPAAAPTPLRAAHNARRTCARRRQRSALRDDAIAWRYDLAARCQRIPHPARAPIICVLLRVSNIAERALARGAKEELPYISPPANAAATLRKDRKRGEQASTICAPFFCAATGLGFDDKVTP